MARTPLVGFRDHVFKGRGVSWSSFRGFFYHGSKRNGLPERVATHNRNIGSSGNKLDEL